VKVKVEEASVSSWLADTGLQLSNWFERWFPDAFALALVAVVIVYAASVGIGNSPVQTAQWFGAGFCRIASIPTNGRNAAAFVAFFSMLSSLLSWSFSLIFSGLLAREVAHRVRDADYRALGAAGYLGLGSVWALGLSSSAALIMATPASLPRSILQISGVIPLSQTLGLWQGILIAIVLMAASMLISFYSHPPREDARDMHAMGVKYQPMTAPIAKLERPGEWLEYSPLLTIVITVFGVAYLAREVADKGTSVILELNHYIFAFLIAGLLLHWRPHFFVHAVTASVPSVAGVLIQYPLYGGIVKMMTESGLAKSMAHFFVAVSTHQTFPVLVGIYSAFLGLFVPSAGGKWLIEAPYILEAAKSLQMHLGWVVQIYNATEALANMIHPFWMLPLLGIVGLKARDIVGYSMLQFVIHVPLVLFLVWVLNYTFR
jgi:short-chain fatty acids transporter